MKKKSRKARKLNLPRAPLPKQVGGAFRNRKKDPPRVRPRAELWDNFYEDMEPFSDI